MKKILLALLFVCSNAFAWDSSSAYNTIAMSYTTNTTITQNIVLNTTQRSAATINFIVDVKNGGGRPTHDLNGNPLGYSSQTDTAVITIYRYNSAGTLLGSTVSSTYVLKNLGSDPGNQFSTAPGDNKHLFTQASVTYTGSLTDTAYIKVEMKGTDGAFWAGNYGAQWRTPTVTIGSSSTNLVYNSEFGVAPNGVQAQGWTPSYGSWAACGVTSGNSTCVTQQSGVTANMWGGGYDSSGGTTTGQSGGYNGTLTSNNASQAASGSIAPEPTYTTTTKVFGSRTLSYTVASTPVTAPSGYISIVPYTGGGGWQNKTYTYTATATGSGYLMFAFRHDPNYWVIDNVSIKANNTGANLLVNGGMEKSGLMTTNVGGQQRTVAAPTAWGLAYQNNANPTLGGGFDSGMWYDTSVGSYGAIYQNVNFTAGVTYTITFMVASDYNSNGGTVQMALYAGSCDSSSTNCTLPTSTGMTTAVTPSQTYTVGCTNDCPTPPVTGPNWQTIKTNSTPVVISNIYPTSNNSPSNEGAANAFDGNPNTKYLNFDKQNAGVTVKLNQGRVVKKFTITTANDSVERDPASYKLYGSNDGVNWVLLSEGPLSLSDSRFAVSGEITVANTNAYIYYFIKFPSIKNNSGNSVQISEVTYYYDLDDGIISTDTGSGGTPSNPGQAGSVCADCAPTWPATSDISLSQTAQKDSAKSRVANILLGNYVYIDQKIGSSGNTVNIEQTGNYNKIAGLGGTEYAIINGDNNTFNIKQGDTLGKNLIEFSVTGNTNNITLWQARNPTTGLQDGSESGGHYIGLNVNGSTNTLSLKQSNEGGTTSGHFAYVDVTGNNNTGTLKQTGNGEKTFFGVINGNTNVFDITQQGTGSYFDLALTGNGHTVTANQKDAGSHKATVNLTNAGGSSTVTLVQQGATAQNINITQQCATLSGCSVSVTQGTGP